ncbi:secretin N-terminal domain-containing protein [Burkholderia pseudomallei]|uniref:secretin N-terminal domain-containing protein n=1 Tax=Burkholderia pseudomallei TaxID=28450 RepID=UPI000A1A11E5|nr:secretin N-terminal domain-containing protein [Burkholderia pseudomallei]ARL38878.1 secretin [Burkholderia pseudomallei]
MKCTASLLALLALLAAFALTGCAGVPFGSSGSAEASPADALAAIQTQQRAAPDDIDVAAALPVRQQDYVRAELKKAEAEASQGNYVAAIDHLGNALREEPGNLKAQQDMRRLERRQQMQIDLARADRLRDSRPQESLDIVRGILVEQPNHVEAKRLHDTLLRESRANRTARPQLADALRKPVTLNFRSQPIASIFDVISRVSGVNFVFDHDVQTDHAATLLAERTTAEDAINLLLRTNQLEKKVLDKHTLLIYPAQPDKARNYQEFALRTFFLSHADAKSVMAALRQMIKPKDIYVDERVNAVVVRDTPETIQVAERVVMGLDIPQSEVTLDVQVLEVNMSDKLDLGVQYPGRIQFDALGGADGSLPMTLGDLLRINRDRIGVSGDAGALSAAINLLQKQGKTKTLANPKIRVRNMEKANIKIGERVPIVTTTNANGVVSESVSYQDVGLILKVEPRISLNEEVSVKVNLEVSSILSKETTKTGLVAYSLGTRNAETLMTAKNGETQILAGLVKRSESADMIGLPGLSGLPVVGRLFGSKATNNEKSEIVLLITPHIERNLDLPEAAVTTFLSGTETRVTTEALTLDSAFAPAGPARTSAPELDEPIEPADVAPAGVTRQPGDAGAPQPDELQAAASTRNGPVHANDAGARSPRGGGMMRMRGTDSQGGRSAVDIARPATAKVVAWAPPAARASSARGTVRVATIAPPANGRVVYATADVAPARHPSTRTSAIPTSRERVGRVAAREMSSFRRDTPLPVAVQDRLTAPAFAWFAPHRMYRAAARQHADAPVLVARFGAFA